MPEDDSVEPPELNPYPHERVQLYVTAPTSLKVSVGATYEIGTWLGTIGGGGTYCGSRSQRNPGPSDMFQPLPKITVPIDLKWDGRAYAGEFLIDRFSPGRCHWTFSSLDTLSPARNFVSLYSTSKVNYNFDTSHSNGVYDQSPVQSTDLWCAPDPTPIPTAHGKVICTSFKYFAGFPGIVAPGLLAQVSAEQREHIPLVNIFPDTKTITVHFHDLAATPLAEK
jgi:hypothetical protein